MAALWNEFDSLRWSRRRRIPKKSVHCISEIEMCPAIQSNPIQSNPIHVAWLVDRLVLACRDIEVAIKKNRTMISDFRKMWSKLVSLVSLGTNGGGKQGDILEL